jgi:hypothetical protein
MKTRKIGFAIVLTMVLFGAVGAMSSEDIITGNAPGVGPNVGRKLEPSAMDLDASFHIPQEKGKDLSHTPAVVFTRDGQRMITATAEKELVVFEAKTRKLLKRHELKEKATDAVSVSLTGKTAVWVLEKGGLVVLDVDSGEILARDDKVSAKWTAISPSGEQLAVSQGKKLEIRRTKDLTVERTIDRHADEITNLTWSRDGVWVGSTAKDGRLLVNEGATGKTVFESQKKGPLYALDFHPTKRLIAFGGDERKVYQVDLDSKKEEVLSGGQPYWITCLAYSPNGQMIALGDESCDVWMYKLDKPGQPAFHSKHHVECWLSQVAWTPDSDVCLFGCRPNTLAHKPALYDPLRRVEVNRSEEVRKTRAATLSSIEKELANTSDEAVKKNLAAAKDVLSKEEDLVAQEHGGGFQLQQQVQMNLAVPNQQEAPNVLVQQQSAPQNAQSLNVRFVRHQAFDESSLPESVRRELAEHRKTQTQADEKMKASFQINQWRVKQ